jgi:hypothetical protein
MPALLFLVGALFTWVALYQGILAIAVGPPPDRELMSISGRIDHVDTPWTRNRFVEATHVKIEVAPVRYVTVAVRQETLATATLKALEGSSVVVRFAGGRPRNRWVYEMACEGKPLISLDAERLRDVTAQRRSVRLMLLNGAVAVALMGCAIAAKRRRKITSQDIEQKL